MFLAIHSSRPDNRIRGANYDYDINPTPRKRKTLSIKTAKPVSAKSSKSIKTQTVERDETPHFVKRDDAVFMVYNPNGYMPKRVYEEPGLACRHAVLLAKQTGEKFHVMRTWRFMEAEDK